MTVLEAFQVVDHAVTHNNPIRCRLHFPFLGKRPDKAETGTKTDQDEAETKTDETKNTDKAATETEGTPSEAKPEVHHAKHTSTVIRTMTGKFLDMLATEMQSVHNQKRLQVQIIDPFIKMLYTHLFPYVLAMCAVMLVILLTSLCTCTMFALLFFRSPIKLTGRAGSLGI